MNIEPDDGYLAALRGLHETLADMTLVTGLALDNPPRAARLRVTLGGQLQQLLTTVRDVLKVIEVAPPIRSMKGAAHDTSAHMDDG